MGALSAALALAFIIHDHSHGLASSAEIFLDLARESAPALLLAYLLVGFSDQLLPSSWLSRIARGGRMAQAMRGVAIGLPLPICSCGIVPIYRELIVRGAPSAAALAFLIATPELEVAAILLTWQLMGTELAITRIVAAAVLALAIGLLLGKAVSKASQSDASTADSRPKERKTPGQVIVGALRFGFGSAVDHTAAWILVGLGVSALLLPHVDPSVWRGSNWDVPIAAALGLPIYVCASGSTPLVAVLVMKGLSPGAALAFLLTGPATNLTTFGMLRQLHGTRIAMAFAGGVMLLACGLGYAADLVLASSETAQNTRLSESEHDTTLGNVMLAALAAVFLSSLLRQGTRPFVEQLFSSPGLRTGGHKHGCD
ncbi:MAG: permease [Planctomycetota bacterium]